jgi:hypothetical protein
MIEGEKWRGGEWVILVNSTCNYMVKKDLIKHLKASSL